MIPPELLLRLAARASTPEERLTAPFMPAHSNHTGQMDARIHRWAELGAKGDSERLQRSLRWRGIDLNRIRPALGDVSFMPEASLPEWVLQFDALLEEALSMHCSMETGPSDERRAVMTPFARAAAAALRRSIPDHVRAGVAESALAALEQGLLVRLGRLAGPVLASEYHAYSYCDSRSGGAPQTRPHRFADHMLRPPLPGFLAEYPVLARLLTLACSNWRAAALELLARLATDRAAIVEQFHAGRDPGLLVDIEVGDADVHDGHREVVILVFEDGFRIVYKPRSMALDHAFHRLIDWLNQQGLSPSLYSPAVLCREGYGWAEFIAHQSVESSEELELFYRRAGVLACIAYVMGATDLHHGNVIAHRGFPVVIDLETMLKAEPHNSALPARASAAEAADLGSERSVLHSLLLPLTHRVPTGMYADVSALGAEPEDQSGSWLPVRDVPLKQLIHEHAADIEAGFTSAYRFIANRREALLSDCGPLAAFKRCAIRVVLRDTALYFQLLRHSIDPAVLRDGVDRRIALERLHHVIAIADAAPSFINIVNREESALEKLDIPRFVVMTGETNLSDASGLVAENVMQRTPLEEMRLRIEAMSEPDLERQCKDIRWAWTAYITEPGSHSRDSSSTVNAALPDAAMLIAAAEQLGAGLLDECREHGDALPWWRGLLYLNAARRFTVGDGGASFADGGLGIAAFFAALFRVTANPQWRDAALGLALRYLTPAADSAGYNGHVAGGITRGLGGSLYGATLIAALLESDEVLESGLALAHRLADRAVKEEKELSLGDGLAGNLLGVTSLRCFVSDPRLDDIVARGASRLRDAKLLRGEGVLSGRAGLALAANRIGLPGDFHIQENRSENPATDWAEGVLGQSLAAMTIDPTAKWALDFLDSFAAMPAAADDSFAFGAAGEADALAWAALRYGRPALHRAALERIAGAAARARAGSLRLLGGELRDGLRLPGLLHGSAGVGYSMLRVAAPDRLPALVVFDLPRDRKVAQCTA